MVVGRINVVVTSRFSDKKKITSYSGKKSGCINRVVVQWGSTVYMYTYIHELRKGQCPKMYFNSFLMFIY